MCLPRTVTEPWLSWRCSAHGLALAGLASPAASLGGSAKTGAADVHSRAAARDQRKEDLTIENMIPPLLKYERAILPKLAKARHGSHLAGEYETARIPQNERSSNHGRHRYRPPVDRVG